MVQRAVLEPEQIHAAVRERVAQHHADIVEQVMRATERDEVVVVGMAQNPHCKRARRVLARAGVAHTYLEFGSYFSSWRRRTALKMWTGWPTFPMVFVRGVLVGGADETEQLIGRGELARMLEAPARPERARA